MDKIAIMLSNYFHDLAVALLASNVLAVYFVGRFLDQSPARMEVTTDLFRKLSRVTYGALAYVLIGGVVRALSFMEYEWNPAVGKGQISALVVKHILLFAITVFGIVVHTRYMRRYGIKD